MKKVEEKKESTRMKLFLIVSISIVAFMLVPSAHAIVWTENGDAGSLPGVAQIVTGSGSLDSISGSLTNGADMFKIYIFGSRTFSATTVGGASFDTQLFLFDSLGMGVYANDDLPYPQSTLPAGHPFTPATAGNYYLAISKFNNDPTSSGGLIFPPGSVVGPIIGFGGDFPITGWTGASYGSGTDSYSISLTGAAPATVIPEPATMLLLGSGLLGLFGIGRKKRT